jgi:hypothetical protein
MYISGRAVNLVNGIITAFWTEDKPMAIAITVLILPMQDL